VVGDYFQLRPVKGRFAFSNHILWSPFQPCFLQGNIRQANDSVYAQLLNRARIGMLTADDIEILKSRIIPPDDPRFQDLLHIFPTRASVLRHNLKCQSQLPGPLYTATAQNYYSAQDTMAGADVPKSYLPDDDRDAGNIPQNLPLSVGTRVMLIRNLNTLTGLVNGAMGVVTTIQTSGSKVISVTVKFDDPSVGRTVDDTTEHLPVEITHFSHEFSQKGRHIVRRNLPLQLAWACTLHKVQGLSLLAAVLDLGSSVFENGMSYVGLSRITHLNKLYLLAFNPSKVQPCDDAVTEYLRLHDLDSAQ
jgi:hypothetical protein